MSSTYSTQLDILQLIWDHSIGEFVFLPTIREGHFDPGIALRPEELILGPYEALTDNYFTPVRYRVGKRLTEYIELPGVLYADLDDVYDGEALDKYPPSVLWETSPGNLQAIWFLSYPVEPETQMALNKRLNAFVHADRSSYIPTKLLRIPGTLNYKRGCVRGRITHVRDALEYAPEVLDDQLPLLSDPRPSDVTVPDLPSLAEWQGVMDKIWPLLSIRTRARMAQAPVSDRSLHLTQLAADMATLRIPARDIFVALSRLSTNKFADRPDVLWNSVVLPATRLKLP